VAFLASENRRYEDCDDNNDVCGSGGAGQGQGAGVLVFLVGVVGIFVVVAGQGGGKQQEYWSFGGCGVGRSGAAVGA
jgi:hypothetical protein